MIKLNKPPMTERECQEGHSRIRWRLKRKRTEMTNIHWTANSNVDFRYSVAADYVDQILEQLDRREMSQSDLAKRVGVSDGRVSQLVNSPGNLTLKTMVDWARAVDLKLAVVLYDDEDQNNLRGPILSDVFRDCWRMCDSPHNWFELYGDDEASVLTSQSCQARPLSGARPTEPSRLSAAGPTEPTYTRSESRIPTKE